jgi:hypothetical protein
MLIGDSSKLSRKARQHNQTDHIKGSKFYSLFSYIWFIFQFEPRGAQHKYTYLYAHTHIYIFLVEIDSIGLKTWKYLDVIVFLLM